MYSMYYFIILLFFLPLTVFADSPEKCSLDMEINQDQILINKKYKLLDFSYCELIGITLNDLDLKNTNFTGSNLSGSNLHGSNFENANFNNAILYGTNFQSSNLENVDFKNSK